MSPRRGDVRQVYANHVCKDCGKTVPGHIIHKRRPLDMYCVLRDRADHDREARYAQRIARAREEFTGTDVPLTER